MATNKERPMTICEVTDCSRNAMYRLDWFPNGCQERLPDVTKCQKYKDARREKMRRTIEAEESLE